MKKRRNGFFSEMSDKELTDWIKDNYKGVPLGIFGKKDNAAWDSARKRGLIDQLVEMGVLVRARRPNGFFGEMSDQKLLDWIKENYNGKTIGFFHDEDVYGYKTARERGLIDQAVSQGILLRVQPTYLTKSTFLEEVKTDEPLRNLAAAALVLNGQGADVERIIMDVYDGRFKDWSHLHSLLQDSTREIYDLIEEGITNLGRYIGDFNVGDRKIVPVLIGEAINLIPYDKISPDLEERLVRILRTTYSPRFNLDPEGTMAEIQTKRDGFEGKKRELYERLNRHYQETLELRGILQ